MIRRVFCILSSNALPYARHAVLTLFHNCLEEVDLTLITDDAEDKATIDAALAAEASLAGKKWRVADKDECDKRAQTVFAKHQNIAAFRDGHPCWRKVTDPLLFIERDEEAITLDPDLYFPNKFTFEETPATGVQIFYQGPNCLYPPAAVEKAFNIPVKLADHVDIGAAQVRLSAFDLDWFDWFCGALDWEEFTPFMHIEAIAWSALAMQLGGGYLDREAWHCWQRGHLKRVAIAAGFPGDKLLRMEPLDKIKCIHVSGPSKWWVVDAIKSGALKSGGAVFDQPTPIKPFIEYEYETFQRQQRTKDLARKLGYYKLTKSE
ncbi:MAG: hypothetical protein HKP25_13360 [Marinicaulis sp.]|nr:hypothetical protein [Marinicaulis sp.]